jgi:DNA-binding NtrC family response regulator
MTEDDKRKNFPILIVDDEPDIVTALINYLDDYEVDFAYDADSALNKVASGNFKIVLADIVMPGMDGIELLRRIKNINPSIQVIMMTGHTTLMRASESLQNGALKYLLKPFDDITDLNKAIDEGIKRIEEWKDVFSKSIRAKRPTL